MLQRLALRRALSFLAVLQAEQLRLSVRCASNNVPDHRFFTIGALYFLDIAIVRRSCESRDFPLAA
jgi:hypothetical protein